MKTFLIIDGNSLANRAFYGVPALSNHEGVATNAIYGFFNMFNKLYDAVKPAYVAVSFDISRKVFRHSHFADYKAQRKPMPEELRVQMPLIREALEHMGITTVAKEGYEGDDIIGTLTRQAEEQGIASIIVSGDRDTFQLVSEQTKVLYPKRGLSLVEEVHPAYLQEQYGLTPEQIIDLKGLMGDASDNIPGIPGVGEKTAQKLLHTYGSIDTLYEHLDDFKGKKLGDKLKLHEEDARLSKKLATIDRHVDLDISVVDLVPQTGNVQELLALYHRLELRELAKKLEASQGVSQNTLAIKGRMVEQYTQMDGILHAMEPHFLVLIPHFEGDKLHSMFLSAGEENYGFLVGEDEEQFISILKSHLMQPHVTVATDDAKMLYTWLFKVGLENVSVVWDCALIHYLLDADAKEHDLETVFETKFQTTLPEAMPELGFASLEAIKQLMGPFNIQLEENGLDDLYKQVELPLTRVLVRMERNGIHLDTAWLQQTSREMEAQLDVISEKIYAEAGEAFNINSPKQLGHILFEKMELPVIKKTKTGYSTSAEVLEALREDHEIVEAILAYRELAKLKSTYVDGLLAMVDDDDNVHTTFTQTVTATGRLSSIAPNLQNIPVRTEEGRRLRQAFRPTQEGYVLISADYSQIELRVLAHLSYDDALVESFNCEEDIHTRTASEVFHVPMEEVNKSMRRAAKAVNFGIVYGQSDFGLAKELKITRKEAGDYIKRYFARYPGVRAYLDSQMERAREEGYVTTLLGRRRTIKDIHSKNFNARSFAERTAINAPIQGSAADIIKLAMLDVDRKLKEEQFKGRLLLQVHDELILEAPPEEVAALIRMVKTSMEQAMTLRVPLKVDVKVGFNWYDMEHINA